VCDRDSLTCVATLKAKSKRQEKKSDNGNNGIKKEKRRQKGER
jgi:hypothetical protein